MGCCSGYTFAPAPDAALDPNQRVNFTFGMVLGVDDFRQEHAYLAARDERALRETIGYGAISGLDVTVRVVDEHVEVRVAAGLALLPDGKLVAVAVDQCAHLDKWLTGPDKPAAGKSGSASVYVVLRHAEVSGTPVPIPGEPCRDESALQADSRIADSFALDFSWQPPTSLEDDGSRTLAAWLRAIEVRDAPVAAVDIPAFQAAVEEGVKAAIANWPRSPDNPPLAATPGVTPVTDWGSPPAHLVIPRARYAEYINAAFDVWVRKLRAIYAAKHGPAPPAETTAETGLLLAAIDFTLDATGNLVYSEASPPALPATARWLGRPQLLHLRMLQEWLLTNVENDAPREAHYVLGKGDKRLPNAQDLASDFNEHIGALARVDLIVDSPPGVGSPPGIETKAMLRPAVKWPGNALGAGGPDYYGPNMNAPIPVSDGGTGQSESPAQGQLLVGSPAGEESPLAPASFRLGRLLGQEASPPNGGNITVDVVSAAPDILLDTVQNPIFEGLTVTKMKSAVLGTDSNGKLVKANPVSIKDGGTGQQNLPKKLQVLVGNSDNPTDSEFVLAELVGEGIDVQLTGPSSSPPPPWEIKFKASASIELPLKPAQGGTGQKNLPELGQLLIGNKKDGNAKIFSLGELKPKTQGRHISIDFDKPNLLIDTTPQAHWTVRIVPGNTKLLPSDHVLVFTFNDNSLLELGDPEEDGRVIIVKVIGKGPVKVLRKTDINNAEPPFIDDGPTLDLKTGQSATLICVTGLKRWLIIGRS